MNDEQINEKSLKFNVWDFQFPIQQVKGLEFILLTSPPPQKGEQNQNQQLLLDPSEN